MISFITVLAIGLTLQQNSATQSWNYPTDSPERYQRKNTYACELLRDSIYTDSEHLEQSNYQYPSDFIIISPQQASENVKNSLKLFDENGCYQNNFIHYSDRDLIKKLEKDLKK